MKLNNTARERFEDEIRLQLTNYVNDAEERGDMYKCIAVALDTYTNELLEEAAIEIETSKRTYSGGEGQCSVCERMGELCATHLGALLRNQGKDEAAALLRNKKV